jgi:hypothetical protein
MVLVVFFPGVTKKLAATLWGCVAAEVMKSFKNFVAPMRQLAHLDWHGKPSIQH